jgi:hypothetical protein
MFQEEVVKKWRGEEKREDAIQNEQLRLNSVVWVR